jgi:CRISPR/Cas system CMR-associated protein Cmr5 small subunit
MMEKILIERNSKKQKNLNGKKKRYKSYSKDAPNLILAHGLQRKYANKP